MSEPIGFKDEHDKTPEALLLVETIASGVITALVKDYGPKSAKAVYEAIKGGEVVFFRIYSSCKVSGDYDIRLGLENLLPHGVYLESMNTVTPDDLPLTISTGRRIEMGEHAKVSALPMLLSPYGQAGASKELFLRIKDPESKLKGRNHINLRCQLVRLDESIDVDKEKKEFTVRLRHSE